MKFSGTHFNPSHLNPFAPERCEKRNLTSVFSKLILQIDILSTSCETGLRRVPQNSIDDQSKLLQVMVWCHRQEAITWANVDRGLCCHVASLGHNELTLSMQGPSYLSLIRSISLLLMPWLLASPGQQQQWHWLWEIGKSLSYTRKNSNYLYIVSVEEW